MVENLNVAVEVVVFVQFWKPLHVCYLVFLVLYAMYCLLNPPVLHLWLWLMWEDNLQWCCKARFLYGTRNFCCYGYSYVASFFVLEYWCWCLDGLELVWSDIHFWKFICVRTVLHILLIHELVLPSRPLFPSTWLLDIEYSGYQSDALW